MGNLRWRLIALLIWVVILSNAERFAALTGAHLVIPLFITLCIILATLLPVTPIVRQNSLLPLWVAVSVLYIFLLFLTGIPQIPSAGIYVVIFGYIGMLITLALSYQVGMSYWEFHRAVADLTFASAGSPLSNIDQVRATIDIEMIRSRRSERPLSLMVFEADTTMVDMRMHNLVQSVQQSMIRRYVLMTVARVLERTLRRTDMVFAADHPNRLFVLAPDTGDQDADRMARRIAHIIRDRIGIEGRYSTVAFPNQALTFEDLLQAAEQQLASAPPVSEEDLALEVGVRRASEVGASEREHAPADIRA